MSAWDDAFTGTDGNPPDSTLWSVVSGSPQINTNRLQLASSDSIKSKFKIYGDFDIQVDFDATGMALTNSWALRMGVYIDDTHQMHFSAVRQSGQSNYQRGVINGGSWAYTNSTRSQISGKLRITKTGTTIYCKYWTTAWASFTGSITLGNQYDPCYITLSLPVWDTNPSVTGWFDNFLVNTYAFGFFDSDNLLAAFQNMAQVEYLEDPELRALQVMAQVEYLEPSPKPENNPATVSGAIAHYKFEPGALTTDALGGTALTAEGAPQSDPNLVMEGSGSVQFFGTSDYFHIADGDLATGYPLKTGDSTKQFTLSWWAVFKSNNIPYIFGKPGSIYSGKYISNWTRWYWVRSGGTNSLDIYGSGGTITVGVPYHFNVMVDGVVGVIKVEVYNSATGAVQYEYFTSGLAEMLLDNTKDWYFGSDSGTNKFSGWGDGFMVFNRILTVPEQRAARLRTLPTLEVNPDGNVYTGDPDIVALWQFNRADQFADSIGSNTLVQNPGAQAATSAALAKVYMMQGDQCGVTLAFGGSSWNYLIADGDLDTGFPFKNGDTTLLGSFCGWWNPQTRYGTAPNRGMIIGKTTSGSVHGWCLYQDVTSGNLCVLLGDGSSIHTYDTGIYLDYNTNYFIGLVINGNNPGSIYVRVFCLETGVVSTYSQATAYAVATNTNNFYIGGGRDPSNHTWGTFYHDHVSAWKRLLTADNIDDIRLGTYAYETPVIELTTDIDGETATTTPELAVKRDLSTAIAGASATSAPALVFKTDLSTTISGETAVPAADLLVTRDLVTDISAVSAVSNIDLTVGEGGPATLELTTDVAGETATTTPELDVVRDLTTDIAAVSATSAPTLDITNFIRLITDIVGHTEVVGSLDVTRDLSTIVSGDSQAEAVLLKVLRVLGINVEAVSDVSDIKLALGGLITSIRGQTSVGDIDLLVLRDLSTTISGETATEGELVVARLLVTAIAGVSSVRDIRLWLGPLTTHIRGVSEVSAADLKVLRDLVTQINAVTTVPSALLVKVIELVTDIVATTDVTDIHLNFKVETAIRAVSATSSPALLVVRNLLTALRGGTLTAPTLLAVLRWLSTNIDVLEEIRDITLVLNPPIVEYVRGMTAITLYVDMDELMVPLEVMADPVVPCNLFDEMTVEIEDNPIIPLYLEDAMIRVAIGNE